MSQQVLNAAQNTRTSSVMNYQVDGEAVLNTPQPSTWDELLTKTHREGLPKATHLRVALFSGNYNYTKDGANQALNKLVAYLEERGVSVRVYSPTSNTPAFEPAGTVVSVPSFAIPGRSEYRCALGMPKAIREDIEAFSPNIVHVSAPDFLGKAAAKYARKRNIPVVASVHTRFENYLKYYQLGWLENALKRSINKFYSKCDRVLAPNACMLDILKKEGVQAPIGIWGRGVDQKLFSPEKRDLAWRRSVGLADDDQVILFVGRLVREKGLEAFADSIDALKRQGVPHRVLVVGDGPGRSCFEKRLGTGTIFTGFLIGEELARAYASADVFLNPSLTEAFGNVMLEAMASGLPAVCAEASGSNSLIKHEINGLLVEPDNAGAFAEALAIILQNANKRTDMQNAARKLADAFSWPTILEAVIEHYTDLCGEFPSQRRYGK